MKNKKLLGYCAVDSGQLLICDTCYIETYAKLPEAQREELYQSYCEVSLSPNKGGQVIVAPPGGTGVNSSTFDGDGSYPVYAEYNKKGELSALKIELQ